MRLLDTRRHTYETLYFMTHMSLIKHRFPCVTSGGLDRFVASNPQCVVLAAYTWCRFCHTMINSFRASQDNWPCPVVVFFMDRAPEEARIQSKTAPVLVAFSCGLEVLRSAGARPWPETLQFLKQAAKYASPA